MSNIFIIVTADGCGHCTRFKAQHLDNLIKMLMSTENLNIIHINLPDMKGLLPTYSISDSNIFRYIKGNIRTINPKFYNMIGWFPQFFIFSTESWLDVNKPLKGKLIGGRILDDGTIQQDPSQNIALTADSIYKWVVGSKIPTKQKVMPGYIIPSKIKYGSM